MSRIREIKTQESLHFGIKLFITTENWDKGYEEQQHFTFHPDEVSKVLQLAKTWGMTLLAFELSTDSSNSPMEIAQKLCDFPFSHNQIRRVFEMTWSHDRTMAYLSRALLNGTTPLSEVRSGLHQL